MKKKIIFIQRLYLYNNIGNNNDATIYTPQADYNKVLESLEVYTSTDFIITGTNINAILYIILCFAAPFNYLKAINDTVKVIIEVMAVGHEELSLSILSIN